MGQQFAVETDLELAVRVKGEREIIDVTGVSVICGKWNSLRPGFIRAGGFREIDMQGWRFDRLQKHRSIRAAYFEKTMGRGIGLIGGIRDDPERIRKLKDRDIVVH